MSLPDSLLRGERSRLFPVLADTSKEGRTLSIFLSCLENVQEFGAAMLSAVGQRTGTRARIETYTEVSLKKGTEKKHRPDGLIVVTTGSRRWTALVEAKVGNTDLTQEQIESYLDLAKLNGVDALLTLSNQFAPLPTHHPIALPAAVRKKAALFHWSWMFVVTQANLLLSNDQVADDDQRVILKEMSRFLTHPSAGVRTFDSMPVAWPNIVSKVQTGGKITASADETREVIGAWHQEVRDLSLVLSRQLGTEVTTRISRAHAADPAARLKASIADLARNECLEATLNVPDAAAPIDIIADLKTRCVTVSMKIKAPADRKSTKARLSWLLRQLQRSNPDQLHIRLFWPGRSSDTQHELTVLRENPELAGSDKNGQVAVSFEVLLVRDLTARFAQRKNFITDLEAAVPDFYEQVGQYLKTWVAPAPRLRGDKSEPDMVSIEAMAEKDLDN